MSGFWDVQLPKGSCRVCGREVEPREGIIVASYLTCNMANDGREGHSPEELRETWRKWSGGEER
jgi:hypothetical protein